MYSTPEQIEAFDRICQRLREELEKFIDSKPVLQEINLIRDVLLFLNRKVLERKIYEREIHNLRKFESINSIKINLGGSDV